MNFCYEFFEVVFCDLPFHTFSRFIGSTGNFDKCFIQRKIMTD